MTHCFLTDFRLVQTQFQSTQESTLNWLVAAHTKAEERKLKLHSNSEQIQLFRDKLKEKLWRVGCKPNVIHKRGLSLPDFSHENWNAMQVYRLHESPEGVGLRDRINIYNDIITPVTDQMYSRDSNPPEDIIHVSCTGYSGPSAIQRTISKREWGSHCTVTHAYHMGCYAALPAIRMAEGFLAATNRKIDIVHTEFCSLHNNPTNHSSDQLVAHSLFADGFIRYSVSSKNKTASLRLLKVYEEIIPNTLDAMLWSLGNWGFEFTLAIEIPVLIMRALKKYFTALCAKAKLKEQDLLANALFAIHPGGPKILNYVQKELELMDEQICYSRAILREHGNMSSATLPHIWEAILRDSKISNGTKIVSLAFGPGLTIAGSILEKEG